jgi:predicted O-methyltransferase YrrM
MDFIDQDLLQYAETHTESESDLLKKLKRDTHLKVNSPRMLSGHLQGRFLSLLSKLCQPLHILEIGTYTGYSALCLAEGLRPGGQLITIDPNQETNHFAKKYFEASDYRDQIVQKEGQAAQLIPSLTEVFDLVFIDADKKSYALYFDLCIEKVRSGGLLIADNVLWSGKVLGDEKDPETLALKAFNKKTATDTRVESLLLPVRDGLMILRKL